MDKATAGVNAPLGFWEYLEANKEEVRKWPGWMTGAPSRTFEATQASAGSSFTAPAQRDAGEKLRLARRIETAIANRNDDETVFDAIKAALLAEGSKPMTPERELRERLNELKSKWRKERFGKHYAIELEKLLAVIHSQRPYSTITETIKLWREKTGGPWLDSDPIEDFELLNEIENDGFEMAHALRACGHSRGDYRDPNYIPGQPRTYTASEFCIGCEREKLLAAAPAPTPAPPTQYSPKGNFCSICRVDNQWCEHIQPPAEPVVPERSVAMRVAEQLMAQNMLDVPCVTALPVIERALRVVPEREPQVGELSPGNEVWLRSRVIAKNEQRGLLIRVDGVGEPIMLQTWVPPEHFDKLAAAPRAAGGQCEPSLTLKQILNVLYHGRTMVNFNHVPSVTRAIDWLSREFRDALAAAEPQVEEGGKT